MGHPVLRAKALPISPTEVASPGVQRLIDDMFETMQEYAGIGLAAPQVHQPLRLFVAGLRESPVADLITDDEDMPYVALVNPEISVDGDEIESGWEGCLSIPDIRGLVSRPARIRVRALDRTGRPLEFGASGLPARVLQHELDHLDGILFFDRMRSFESLSYMDEYRRHWATDDDDDDDDDGDENGVDEQ